MQGSVLSRIGLGVEVWGVGKGLQVKGARFRFAA